MRVVRAKALGICFGVRRAINNVAEATEVREPIDSLCADGFKVVIYGEDDHPEVNGVGAGRNSASTHRLAQTCAGTGVETHHIERADEIVARLETLGVQIEADGWTAGSRPRYSEVGTGEGERA